MNVVALVNASPWISAALAGGLLITCVAILLLALAGTVLACYVAVPRVRRGLNARLHLDQPQPEDLGWYQLIEVTPPAAPSARVRRPPSVLDVARQAGPYGFGMWLFAESAPVPIDPTLLLGGLLVLLLLSLALLADGSEKPPRQRSFDDYLDELQRESDRYLDQVNRFRRDR